LNAVLIMLAQHALLIAISSDLNAYGVVCEFDWNDGNGQEGWPSMDGSEGIRITEPPRKSWRLNSLRKR
ncbi:DUF2528 family protein, partial [Escherichia coli]